LGEGSLDAKLADSLPNLTSAGPVQAVDTWAYVPVIGHSIEPTGTGARDHTVGTVSVIAGVQGDCRHAATAGMRSPNRLSGFRDLRPSRTFPGFEAFEDMVRKL
jgi:hypothetical protein